MSDYLGHLVMRALSQAPMVRPQLPSLFEPSVASDGIGSELEIEQETLSEPLTLVRTPRPSSLGELQSTPITRPSETPISSESAIETANQSETAEYPPSITKQPAHKQRESEPLSLQTKTSVAPVASEQRRIDSDADQHENVARRGKAPTEVSQLSAPNSQQIRPNLVRAASNVEKARAVQAVVPSLRSSPQFPASAPPASAPTVNVTIGRVEIRANVSAPPPVRPRPKPGNVLSLEDYLRQRSKGGGS